MASVTQDNTYFNVRNNTTLMHQEPDRITELKEQDTQNDSDRNTADRTTAENTSYVLEEFDEILKEINMECLPNECASLDEVDDVLKNINDDSIHDIERRENNIDLMVEVPKFDFEDLIEIHLVSANYKDEYIDINYWEGVNQADGKTLSSDGSQIESNEHQGFDRNVEHFIEPINVDDEGIIEVDKDETKKVNEDIHQNLQHTNFTSDVPKYVNYNEKSIKRNNNREEEATMIIDLKNEDYKNVDEDEKMAVDGNNSIAPTEIQKTNKYIDCNNVFNINENSEYESVKDKEELNEDDTEDDGYRSSDFEFITEAEAKLESLIINFNPDTNKRKATNSNAQVKTIDITIDKIPVFATKRQKTRHIESKSVQKDTNIAQNNTYSVQNDIIQKYNIPSTGKNKLLAQNGNKADAADEKWRAFKIRNQNQPFVPDNSYRESHNIPGGDQYYQLFDPTLNPIVHNIRGLERKDIFPRSKKLAAYEGVGFDMEMIARCDSDDDDVKEAARESRKKILALYPGENKKRRQSRRF